MKNTSIALLMTLAVVGFHAKAEVADVAIAERSGKTQEVANDREILETPRFEDALVRAGTSKQELGINPEIVAIEPDGQQKIFTPDQWETVRRDALRGLYRNIQFRPSTQRS